MITEIILTGLIYNGYKYLSQYKEHEIKKKFQLTMEGIGIKNKKDETFKIIHINKTNYGFRATIEIPYGLSMEHLNNKINILQDNLNGIIVFDKDNFKPYINMNLVDRDVDKFTFKPVKCKPYELYIGKEFTLKNYILNTRIDPMVLIAGCTGTGKSFLLASILANLIYNSSNYIEIYLLQVSKSELSAFDECECVVEACYKIDDCIDVLRKILKTIDSRSNKFKEKGIRNIAQWNKHYKNQYMKEIYIIIEELSFFMNMEEITSISKIGRSVGVHIITCIQRTVATEMDSTLKSQMSKITFRQKSYIDSINVIGTNDAKNLNERECIVDSNSSYIKLKTAWIDEDYVLLHKYVKEIKIPEMKKNDNQQQIKIITNQKENEIKIDNENMIISTIDNHKLIEAEIIEEEKRDDGIMDIKEFKKNVKRKGL